jgi:periplasmic divalent cation tolerance protein
MSEVKIVLSTIDNIENAQKVAATLVDERLAACVNIVPAVSSIYRWKGQLQHDQESLLIIKTCADRIGSLTARILTLHPYDTPEVISLGVEEGLPEYLGWVRAETSAQQ